MSRPGPAPERGGTPDALANLRRGGLKKARATSVIADMTSAAEPDTNGDRQPEGLYSVPAPEPEVTAPVQQIAVQPPAAQAHAEPQPAAFQPQPARVPVESQPAPVQMQPVQAPAALPTQPATQQQYVYAQPVQYAPRPEQATVQVAPSMQEEESPAKKVYRKTSFFQSKESGSRMRAAYMATRHLTGSRTLSDFILAAVEREVEALERAHNGGNEFAVDPGGVPRGRPLES